MNNKMKKIRRGLESLIFLLLLILLWELISFSQDTSKIKHQNIKIIKDTLKVSDSVSITPPVRVNNAFMVGERFVFDINYGFVTAGRAVMEIPDYEYYKERKSYHVECRVNSLPFFSTFYKVDDKYSSLIDVEGIYPWKFEQHIREGGYKRDFIAEFDHFNGKVVTNKGTYNIKPFVFDIISAFYYTRTLDFANKKAGDQIHLENFYKDTTHILDVKFKGRQIVEVDAGEFRCIIIEPIIREGSLFKNEGTLFIWLTDDDRKIPVKIESKILIGSIKVELIEYSGINGAIDAKVK
jgi:hypothetical protein